MDANVTETGDARTGAEQATDTPAAENRQSTREHSTKPGRAKPSARRRGRVAEGVYRDRHRLAATVKVNGVQREVRFPPGTPLKTIRARRDELRASLRTLPAGGKHSLNHDAARYLDQVRSTLISFGDRRRELLAWLPRFGHLRTLALPAHLPALNAQLHQWRDTLAASTCNHRRHALTNLVRVLYGRRASFDLLDLVRFATAAKRVVGHGHVFVPSFQVVVPIRGMKQAGAYRAGSGLSMLAAGVRGGLPQLGGFQVAVKSDAVLVRTVSDEVASRGSGNLAAAQAGVSRVRAALEGSRELRFAGGRSLTPWSWASGRRRRGGGHAAGGRLRGRSSPTRTSG